MSLKSGIHSTYFLVGGPAFVLPFLHYPRVLPLRTEFPPSRLRNSEDGAGWPGRQTWLQERGLGGSSAPAVSLGP